MSEVITRQQVETVLDELVQEFGEDHKAECYYTERARDFDDDLEGIDLSAPVTPLCIAGHVVYRFGGEDALVSIEGTGQIDSATISNASFAGLKFDRNALSVLAKAQLIQDGSMGANHWGNAVKEAKNVRV